MGSSSLKHSEGRCRSLRVYRPPKFAWLAAQTGTAWEGETRGLLDFRKPKRGAKKPQKIEISWDFIKNMWDSFLQHLRESHEFLTQRVFYKLYQIVAEDPLRHEGVSFWRWLISSNLGGIQTSPKFAWSPKMSQVQVLFNSSRAENPLVSLLITPAVVLLVELVGSGFV